MSQGIHIIKLESPHWGIFSTYFSRSLIDVCKAVPGMRFEKSFDAPIQNTGVVKRHHNIWVGYSDAVVAVAARLKHNGIRVEWDNEPPTPDSWREARTPYVFAVKELRNYQVEGVRFLLARARGGALLGDAMRLGKTRQAITAARAFKEKAIVLCPPHIAGVWSRPDDDPAGAGELALAWPNATVAKLAGVKPTPIEATTQVVVCHYEIAYAWVEELLKWAGDRFTLVVDEIHLIVGYTSRRSKAIEKLRAQALRCIGLSGTPMANNPRKFHNVLSLLSPRRFGFFFIPDQEDKPVRPSYARVFCDSQQETFGKGEGQKTIWKHEGATSLDKPDGVWTFTQEETLHARVQHFMLRRLKKEVDPELPTKTRQFVDVIVPARAMIGVTEKSFAGDGAVLRRCLDLAADGKLRSVVDLIVNHCLEGEKVIAFCYRRAFAERVALDVARKHRDTAAALRVEWVHGGVSQKDRDLRIAAIRKHDGPALLACTIDTTATGIDLSFASVAVVAELSWEPHELAQAEERLYKFGAANKNLIQYVIARGTGDELVARAVVSKLDMFERVIGKTGDDMHEDFAKQKNSGLKTLYAALLEQQKAAPVDCKKKRVR